MNKLLNTSGIRTTFERDFEQTFEDWCENRVHGNFTKGKGLKCDVGGGVVRVRKRSVMPFDTYVYVENIQGDVSVNNVNDYETDGTKLTLKGSQETIHIGPEGQTRMDFNSQAPSQHERSEIRDREIKRSSKVSDVFASR